MSAGQKKAPPDFAQAGLFQYYYRGLSTGNFADSPGVPPSFKGSGQKSPGNVNRSCFLNEADRQSKHVGIVVFPCEACQFREPAKRRSDALMFIGGYCHAIAASAQDYPQLRLARFHHIGGWVHKVRVINGVRRIRAEVPDRPAF
jgi:hypothetical protein